jgi:hypothetical protein
VGVAHNGLEGLLGENRSPRQSYLGHALADICQALCLRQGQERGADADVLRHATESSASQVLQQRRLADQHNLEGRLPRGAQIRQQWQLLEGFAGQVLRLIDDERYIPPLMDLVPEELL